MKKLFLISIAFILTIGLAFSQNPQVACNPQDSLALVALYDSTGGNNWTHNDGWLTDSVYKWYGVSLDPNGRVVKIILHYNNLTGTIPPDIGNLDSLTYLDLSTNHLTGKIPHEIGNLTKLTNLDFAFNQLSDSIPNEICNLTNLENLILMANNLVGPIPENIDNLSHLKYLYLAQNQLTGPLPESITNITTLERIQLCCNQLSGTIPANIGNLTNLDMFMIPNNNFSGQLPSSMANLTKLEELVVFNNNFSGTIPDWIYNLTSLSELDLGQNQFSGQISPQIGNLTNLTQLDLQENNLSGNIPKQIGNLTKLTELFLSKNNLSGQIPPEMGNLTHLERLWLYENHLTGSIPASFGNLSSIQELYLRNNNLTGNSADFSSCSNLQKISVSYNYLDFGDLDSMNLNCDSIDCSYSPQGPVYLFANYSNNSVTFWVHVDGANNQYQWYKNDTAISGANDTTITVSLTGNNYSCKITNPRYPNLTLESYEIFANNNMYNVTFNVFDESSNPIQYAWVIIGNDSAQTNANGQVTLQIHNGAYHYTVRKQGFKTYNGIVQITNQDDTVNINLIRLNTITFIIIDPNTNPIENAWVVLGQDSMQTNQDGAAMFSVPNGTYIYRVYATGFLPATDTLSIQNNDSTVVVTLNPQTYIVRFIVTDQNSNPLPGAWVVLGQDSTQTGTDGKAQFSVPNGSYNYRVYKNGYNQATGTVTVNNANVDVPISLTQLSTSLYNINKSVQIYPNPTSQKLTIKSNSTIKQIIIYDITGKKIKSLKINKTKTIIDISELKPDIYLLRIFTQNGLITTKITKF